MLNRLVFLFLIFCICYPASTKADVYAETVFKDYQKIDLMQGVYKDVEMPDLPDESKFKIDDRDFTRNVSISWDNKKKIMRFDPKRQGTALITILDKKTEKVIKQIRVFVNKNDLDRVAKEMKSLLGNIEGIKIGIMSNKVVVDGQIILPSDFNRISSVVEQYKDRAISLVQLSPLSLTKIASLIERDINNPQITVRVVNGFFILEGVARDLDEQAEAIRIAQAYLPAEVSEFAAGTNFPGMRVTKKKKEYDGEFVLGRVINHLRIQPPAPSRPPKVIQILVHYVELQKSYQRGFNFRWTPTLTDDSGLEYERNLSGGAQTAGTIKAIITNLLPRLNWAKEHGHARVLHSMSMLTQDGEEGFVGSNRQINTVAEGALGQTNQSTSNAKIEATVTPQIMGSRSDIVALKININVDEILERTADGNLISKNNVRTNITVRAGESAAIGGLVTSRSTTDYNTPDKRMPDDPLFKLYSSKNFQRGQSQFVVFITPMIKSSASSGVEKIKRKFRLEK